MHKETHDAAELDVRFKNWVENGITSYCIIRSDIQQVVHVCTTCLYYLLDNQ